MVSAANQMTLDIQFDRANKLYQPMENVTGTIELKKCQSANIQYDSVHLLAEGFMDTVSIIRGDLGRAPLPPNDRIMFMTKSK